MFRGGRHPAVSKAKNKSNYNITAGAISPDCPLHLLLLSVATDGSLAEINTDRWRLMSLNSVNGLSPSNPV